MKKALIYSLSLALLLVSLTACHKPQAEQTDQSEPIQAATSESVQDPAASPEPAENTAPEPEPEQTPAAPVETEASQPLEETTPPETPEETPEQSPKTAVPQTTPPTSQQPSSSYGDDLTPEQYAEIQRQLREDYINSGGTITDSGRDGQISDSEEEYIGTILNGGTPQYNSTETQSSGQQQTPPSGGSKGDFVPGPGMKDPSQNQTDWSDYVSSEGQHSTGEEIVESWKGIQ